MLDSKFGAGQNTAWWGWWRPFEQRFWWNDGKVWVGVVDGSLSKAIVVRLMEVLKIADSSNFRPLFEQASDGTVPTSGAREAVKVAGLTREICDRKDARLIGHLLAVEAANWPLRRALAKRIATRIGVLVADSPHCEVLGDVQGELTQIYGGIGFRLRARPALQVHLEFQSWGCRNAILGLCVEGQDGSSEEAADLRQRLVAAGMATGKHSRGWVWYLPLDTPNWFDQPSVAVSAWEGKVAQQTADLLLGLVKVIHRAGLLD